MPTPVSVNVSAVEPSGEKSDIVEVVQRYIPVLQTNRPAYGVVSVGAKIVVALSDKAPKELVPLLQDELNLRIGGIRESTDAAHFVERLAHAYLNHQVICGNVRYDRVSQRWRWIG